MIRLKVHNGTLPDKRLCDSCRNGTVMKHSDGTERITCCAISSQVIEITKKVVECSDYTGKTEKTKYEMEKMAWILNVKGKTILGFKPPSHKDED